VRWTERAVFSMYGIKYVRRSVVRCSVRALFSKRSGQYVRRTVSAVFSKRGGQ